MKPPTSRVIELAVQDEELTIKWIDVQTETEARLD
jgi:hypothetical protein